jgi:hypothetical protein
MLSLSIILVDVDHPNYIEVPVEHHLDRVCDRVHVAMQVCMLT